DHLPVNLHQQDPSSFARAGVNEFQGGCHRQLVATGVKRCCRNEYSGSHLETSGSWISLRPELVARHIPESYLAGPDSYLVRLCDHFAFHVQKLDARRDEHPARETRVKYA